MCSCEFEPECKPNICQSYAGTQSDAGRIFLSYTWLLSIVFI